MRVKKKTSKINFKQMELHTASENVFVMILIDFYMV